MFRNTNLDSGRRSSNNESSRFGRGSRPFVDNDSQGRSYGSGGSRFGRSQDGESQSQFSCDLELKVNSGDIGKIIGTYIHEIISTLY